MGCQSHCSSAQWLPASQRTLGSRSSGGRDSTASAGSHPAGAVSEPASGAFFSSRRFKTSAITDQYLVDIARIDLGIAYPIDALRIRAVSTALAYTLPCVTDPTAYSEEMKKDLSRIRVTVFAQDDKESAIEFLNQGSSSRGQEWFQYTRFLGSNHSPGTRVAVAI